METKITAWTASKEAKTTAVITAVTTLLRFTQLLYVIVKC